MRTRDMTWVDLTDANGTFIRTCRFDRVPCINEYVSVGGKRRIVQDVVWYASGQRPKVYLK